MKLAKFFYSQVYFYMIENNYNFIVQIKLLKISLENSDPERAIVIWNIKFVNQSKVT